MFESFFRSLFGCSHKRLTFPMTPRRSANGLGRANAHVTCLDCGQEFAYDWNTMQVGKQVAARTTAAPVVAGRTA